MPSTPPSPVTSDSESASKADHPRMWQQVTGVDPAQFRRATPPPSWRARTWSAASEVGKAYRSHSGSRLWRLALHMRAAGESLNAWVARWPDLSAPAHWWPLLRDSLVQPLAWIGRLCSQVLDLLGLAELWDLAGQVLKPGTRPLSALEIAEARKVYGDAILWEKVRVDENSALAKLGKWLQGAHGMGIVIGHTVHFSRRITPQPGNGDMAWLVHELMHVLQCQLSGLQYIGEAVHAQYSDGYAYGGVPGLQARTFRAFNREQQGDIARDYYYKVLYQRADPHPFLPHIADIRSGKI